MPGGGGDAGSTVTRTEPPEFMRPFLQRSAQEAERQFDQPRQFFPGQTFVDPSQQTLGALDLLEQSAMSGSPVIDAAQQNVTQTLQGDFANPFFQQAFEAQTRPLQQQFLESTLPGINSAFIAAGRQGSPAQGQQLNQATDLFTRNLAEVGGNLAFSNFQNERGRQLQAAGLAPTINELGLSNARLLGQVGAAREGLEGQGLQEDIARFQFEQNERQQALRELTGILNATNLGQVSTEQELQGASNPFTGALGGAASGAAVGTLFGPGYGTAIGAGLGGLLGAFA